MPFKCSAIGSRIRRGGHNGGKDGGVRGGKDGGVRGGHNGGKDGGVRGGVYPTRDERIKRCIERITRRKDKEAGTVVWKTGYSTDFHLIDVILVMWP